MGTLISWRNWADSAVLTPTYQALTAAIDAAYPLANLLTRQLGTVCRYTTGGYVVASADLGVARPVKIAALLALRIRRYDPSSGSSNSYVFDVQVSNSNTYSPLVWSGSVTSTINPLKGAPANVYSMLPDGIVGRYVRVRATFGQPVGETFRECGRLWIGDGLYLAGDAEKGGFEQGWSMGYVDTGILDSSAGQQNYESPQARVRRLGVSVSCNDIAAYGFDDTTLIHYGDACLQALQLEAGITGEVIALPRTNTPLWMQAIGVYGHVDRPFDILHESGPSFRASFGVVEER